jgi:hypothetical protein
MSVMKFFAALFLPVLSWAAILPDTIGSYHRTATLPQPALQDKPVWDEYALKETESARYDDGTNQFTVTAWQLADTTGSMAAFDWQRPPKSIPSKLAPLTVETPDSVLLVHGNYLLSFTGHKPEAADVAALGEALKNVDTTPLPTLPGYLPSQDLVPNSERYVIGPEGLAKLFPGVPPSVAAFHFSAEAATGVYRTPKGDMPLAIFNYPTHQIAMQREPEFAKVPSAMVKRSGPLVAVVLNPPDPDAAERLLGQVRYQATVTRSEYVPTRRDNIGNLVINAFYLIGILLVFALVSGLAVGGFRAFRRYRGKGEEADAILTLHLDQR